MITELDESKSLYDYLGILKRRKLAFLLPFVAVFIVFLVVAVSLPATYKSKATILIEEQEIPQEYLHSTLTNFAAQQVQVIQERVLTTANIADIVEKFDLYQQEEAGSRLPLAQIAKKFRKDMKMNLVRADTIDPRSGKERQVTIAFTLAFKSQDPVTTQAVADELVTLFLTENVRGRTDKAASTAQFLDAEATLLNEELSQLEHKLAEFKLENEGSLPNQYKFNVSTLERTTRENASVVLRIQDLEKRKIKLVAEMAQQSPTVPLVLPSGDVVLSDLDRLKSLQSEYRRIAAIYRDNHPDVARLAREIKALEADLGAGADVGYLRMQLTELQAVLAELRARYNDNYHEVQVVSRIIQELKRSIRQAESQPAAEEMKTVADNPTYVFLRTQLTTTESELRSLQERRSLLDTKTQQYETLLKRSPNVERDYQALVRDYENAQVKYQEIRSKQREAASVSTLEQKQKGQRFVLLEPPALPHKSISPNRQAIVFLGLIVGLCVGLVSIVVREAMDGAIYGIRELTAIMGEPPLVAIPYIDNDQDVYQRKRAIQYSLLAAVSVGVAVLFYLHMYLQPLDALFLVMLKNLGLL